METHGNQVLVNAHMLLANLGSDAFIFNVDLDEIPGHGQPLDAAGPGRRLFREPDSAAGQVRASWSRVAGSGAGSHT